MGSTRAAQSTWSNILLIRPYGRGISGRERGRVRRISAHCVGARRATSRVSPGGELLEGLLGVLTAAGNRGAEGGRAGDDNGGGGRASHQGLRGAGGGGAEEGGGAADGDAEERRGRHCWWLEIRRGGRGVTDGLRCS